MSELLIVIAMVAAAVAYLAWVLYRAVRAGEGSACAGGCGCERSGPAKDHRLGRRIDLVSLGAPEQPAAKAKQNAREDTALTGRS